jgi:hypothetical protein
VLQRFSSYVPSRSTNKSTSRGTESLTLRHRFSLSELQGEVPLGVPVSGVCLPWCGILPELELRQLWTTRERRYMSEPTQRICQTCSSSHPLTFIMTTPSGCYVCPTCGCRWEVVPSQQYAKGGKTPNRTICSRCGREECPCPKCCGDPQVAFAEQISAATVSIKCGGCNKRVELRHGVTNVRTETFSAPAAKRIPLDLPDSAAPNQVRRTEDREPRVIDSTRGYKSGAPCPRSGCKGIVTHRRTQSPTTTATGSWVNGVDYVYEYSQCSKCNWHTLNS